VGYRVALEEGETFEGTWRDDTVDEENDDRPVYLFTDPDGELCFSRHYAALERELDAVRPLEVGTRIAIARGANYRTQYDGADEKSGYSFGVAVDASTAVVDDGIPF
jgi:hypothetical protein